MRDKRPPLFRQQAMTAKLLKKREAIDSLKEQIRTLRNVLKNKVQQRNRLRRILEESSSAEEQVLINEIKQKIAEIAKTLRSLTGQRTGVLNKLINNGIDAPSSERLRKLNRLATLAGNEKRELEQKQLDLILLKSATDIQKEKLKTLNTAINKYGTDIRRLEKELHELVINS